MLNLYKKGKGTMLKDFRPADYGLPEDHETLRDSQADLYTTAYRIKANGGGFLFGEAPTGTGKTAVAAMLGRDGPILYVAGTLGLLDQAEKSYGFKAIRGRQEYPCKLETKVRLWAQKWEKVPTASDCHFSPMSKCPAAGVCPYLAAKIRALSATRAACTYKYLMLSSSMQNRTGTLFLDEAHEAVEEVIGFCEFTITAKTRDYWGLPDFPLWGFGDKKGGLLEHQKHQVALMRWFEACRRELAHGVDPTTPEGVRALKLSDRFDRVAVSLLSGKWFLEVGHVPYKGPALRLRSLDPRPWARRMWAQKDIVLLVSATIGKTPKALSEALGIEEYESKSYPHPIPWGKRPVYDLEVPRMTKRALDQNPALFTVQAAKIKGFIEKFPDDWRGLVLAPSYKKISMLRKLLSQWLPPERVIPLGEGSTRERIKAFKEDPRSGIIAVDTIQGWGHGLDLPGDLGRFVVVAGVPFDNPADAFTQARRRVHDSYLWWKSYQNVPQACGRVSRGMKDDNGDWLLNVAAVADGSATSGRARANYPEWFEIKKG